MDSIIEHISIDFANDNDDDLEIDLSLEELNSISEEIIDKGIDQIDEALDKAELDPRDLDLIILAGGSSQLPLVYKKIRDKFNVEPHIIAKNLMLAISYGAALYQREIFDMPKIKRGIKTLGYSLGLTVSDGNNTINQLLLNYNQTLPAKYKKDFVVENGQDAITLRLVSLQGINSQNATELKRRTISLPAGHSDTVSIEINVDENKLIELIAYDPKTPENKTMLTVDNSLTDEAIRSTRKKLGIRNNDLNIKYSDTLQPFIGLDLGTTTSEVTFVNRSGEVELKYIKNPDLIPNEYSEYCFPSVVYFKDGKDDVEVSNNVACEAKKDSSIEYKVFTEYKVEDISKNLGYINDEGITVKDLSTIVLNKIWMSTKEYFKDINLEKAVVTVPASFNSDQCAMTYEAARIAGIEDVTLIDEPTAAFLYYRYQQGLDTTDIRNVLVFDFGGGTTDIAILDVKNEAHDEKFEYKNNMFTVLANVGSSECGGKFIDEKIYEYIECKFLEETKWNLNKRSARTLRSKVEEIKVKLSEAYYESGDIDD